jgi:acetolactate synthase-1/2/3 large subunit
MPTQPWEHDIRPIHAILRALEEGGVRYVVGMPGGLTSAIWRALYDHPDIRGILVREESIGMTMAEAYGRMTGEPIAVMGQGEWIAGNAGQGSLEAALGSSPIVILTEMSDGGTFSHHAPYQAGTGDYGTWSAQQALAGVTKRVMVSHTPAQAVQQTQLALKHAVTGQPGPVAVLFRSTALDGYVRPREAPRIYPTTSYLPKTPRCVDEQKLTEAIGLLTSASRPIIIAGNGVRLAHARESLLALARELDAPVATTSSGKGVFPESDPLGVGVMGIHGWPSANTAIAQSDLVLAIGTKLGSSDTMHGNASLLDPSRQTMIQVDIEPLNAGWTHPVDVALIGDADYVITRLCEEIRRHGPVSRATAARDRAAAARAFRASRELAIPEEVEGLLNSRQIIAVINDVVPPNTVITADAGENRLFMMHWYETQPGGEYLQPAAGGGMGYAVPAAMGAKLANPSRPVLAVCGDGGFSMGLHALMSAVEENLPIGVVVMNNSALGWVKHGMGRKPFATDFNDYDLAAIARTLGCEARRVTSETELRDALAGVEGSTRPFVIDIKTSLATSFQDIIQRPEEYEATAADTVV